MAKKKIKRKIKKYKSLEDIAPGPWVSSKGCGTFFATDVIEDMEPGDIHYRPIRHEKDALLPDCTMRVTDFFIPFTFPPIRVTIPGCVTVTCATPCELQSFVIRVAGKMHVRYDCKC